jgi:hypothetical protein
MPAQAGIQSSLIGFLDSRLRGNDKTAEFAFLSNATPFPVRQLQVCNLKTPRTLD